jgi:hypothetical protein
MPSSSNAEVKIQGQKMIPPRPIPPKATVVRQGADFWRMFNLSPKTWDKPDE